MSLNERRGALTASWRATEGDGGEKHVALRVGRQEQRFAVCEPGRGDGWGAVGMDERQRGAAMYEVWKQTVSHMQRTVQAVTSLCSRRSVVGERDRPSTCDSQRNFEFLRPLKSQNSLCNCHTLALEAP